MNGLRGAQELGRNFGCRPQVAEGGVGPRQGGVRLMAVLTSVKLVGALLSVERFGTHSSSAQSRSNRTKGRAVTCEGVQGE